MNWRAGVRTLRGLISSLRHKPYRDWNATTRPHFPDLGVSNIFIGFYDLCCWLGRTTAFRPWPASQAQVRHHDSRCRNVSLNESRCKAAQVQTLVPARRFKPLLRRPVPTQAFPPLVAPAPSYRNTGARSTRQEGAGNSARNRSATAGRSAISEALLGVCFQRGLA